MECQQPKHNFLNLKNIVYIYTLFFLSNIYSQEEPYVFKYTENNKTFDIDTSNIESFHKYRKDYKYLWLGNNGLQYYSIIYDKTKQQKFYHSKLLNNISNKYYRSYDVSKPFTSASYVQGARAEQFFKILHTQNFSKNGNFSLEYEKINSEGSYERQKANNNNIIASFLYGNKNKKYQLNFFAQRIKNTTEQNGGLKHDSLFTSKSELSLNRKTLSIRLDSAYEKKTANILVLNQNLRLKNTIDSTGIGNVHNLIFNTKYSNSKRFYVDSRVNSLYYKQILIDSSKTKDSIILNVINQNIAYNIMVNKTKNSINISPKLKYEYFDYRQANYHTYYNNLSLQINSKINSKKYNINADFEYHFLGYRNKTYNLDYIFSKKNKNLKWFLYAGIHKITPSLDLQKYYGNHNKWENNFIPTQYYSFALGIDSNKWNLKLNIEYNDIKNPIYFKYNENPTQSLDFSQVIKTNVEKEINLQKWTLTPKFVYQYTGGTIIYRLPNYYGSLNIGYNFKVFKGSLSVFAGSEITYYNKLYLMNYSYSLGQFYIAENKHTGNYPFVDFFINTRIKNVRIFFAMTHINSGFLEFSDNYFGAVNYPLEDRAYKIGINWIFLK